MPESHPDVLKQIVETLKVMAAKEEKALEKMVDHKIMLAMREKHSTKDFQLRFCGRED